MHNEQPSQDPDIRIVKWTTVMLTLIAVVKLFCGECKDLGMSPQTAVFAGASLGLVVMIAALRTEF